MYMHMRISVYEYLYVCVHFIIWRCTFSFHLTFTSSMTIYIKDFPLWRTMHLNISHIYLNLIFVKFLVFFKLPGLPRWRSDSQSCTYFSFRSFSKSEWAYFLYLICMQTKSCGNSWTQKNSLPNCRNYPYYHYYCCLLHTHQCVIWKYFEWLKMWETDIKQIG